jgi:hypothetical protein
MTEFFPYDNLTWPEGVAGRRTIHEWDTNKRMRAHRYVGAWAWKTRLGQNRGAKAACSVRGSPSDWRGLVARARNGVKFIHETHLG